MNSHHHKPPITASADNTETNHTESCINMQAHTHTHVTHNLGTNNVYLAWH